MKKLKKIGSYVGIGIIGVVVGGAVVFLYTADDYEQGFEDGMVWVLDFLNGRL